MKFPYVPLDAIIAEAAGEMKKLNRQGGFDEDDAYNYGIEAARLIGGNNWEEESTVITISKHVGILPRDFYTANDLWSLAPNTPGEAVNSILEAFKLGTITTSRKSLMYPGDSATVRLLGDKGRTPHIGPAAESYTLKTPPCVIRTSFRDGYVGMSYNAFPKDSRGIVMIQDEQNCIVAVKQYMKLKMVEEDYYSGQLARHIYKDIEDSWYIHKDQAKAIQKFPDPANRQVHAAQVHNRYGGFKLD